VPPGACGEQRLEGRTKDLATRELSRVQDRDQAWRTAGRPLAIAARKTPSRKHRLPFEPPTDPTSERRTHSTASNPMHRKTEAYSTRSAYLSVPTAPKLTRTNAGRSVSKRTCQFDITKRRGQRRPKGREDEQQRFRHAPVRCGGRQSRQQVCEYAGFAPLRRFGNTGAAPASKLNDPGVFVVFFFFLFFS